MCLLSRLSLFWSLFDVCALEVAGHPQVLLVHKYTKQMITPETCLPLFALGELVAPWMGYESASCAPTACGLLALEQLLFLFLLFHCCALKPPRSAYPRCTPTCTLSWFVDVQRQVSKFREPHSEPIQCWRRLFTTPSIKFTLSTH